MRGKISVSWGISTVFSTGVENSGDRPNEHELGPGVWGGELARKSATLAQRRADPYPPSLTLLERLRYDCKFTKSKSGSPEERDEGQAHIPAKYPPPQARSRVPGTDEYEEWPSGFETSPRQGPEASYCQQRITFEVPPEPADPPTRRFPARLRAWHSRSWTLLHAVHEPQWSYNGTLGDCGDEAAGRSGCQKSC